MNSINPSKLLLSKWTAVNPSDNEKHFQVTRVFPTASRNLIQIELLALTSSRKRRMVWTELKDDQQWQPGWR
ncbi:TIGR02450 family Trp-rich protein [Motiliproteus coralliicola]|uniref:TIGR02450 family Trp-rich protein n=1 Tax=Motiliproteus coralliicola TaxID=2283196 RepID=A0A369WDY7_9GAMM|nr:TIGR02450 family Trp-rich protein [Motiliproteus coralliicola]RDE19513.1 TIGR02450 family Trp-rich protein [Motiliproteus coralliicola]